MRGRGFEPRTEQMLNAGNGPTPTSQHETTENHYPAPNQNPSSIWILRSTAPRGAGMCSRGTVTVAYIACNLCKGRDGANMSLLRVRGKLSVLPYAPTPQQRALATAEEYY